MAEYIVCTPKSLPKSQLISAAKIAGDINPVNHPALHRLKAIMPSFVPTPERIAVVTTKCWGSGGVRLTVGFLDNPAADLRARILSHMNAWNGTANVQFVETAVNPQVRIARTAVGGYWSYLGTDVSSIPANQPTMNLDSFS